MKAGKVRSLVHFRYRSGEGGGCAACVSHRLVGFSAREKITHASEGVRHEKLLTISSAYFIKIIVHKGYYITRRLAPVVKRGLTRRKRLFMISQQRGTLGIMLFHSFVLCVTVVYERYALSGHRLWCDSFPPCLSLVSAKPTHAHARAALHRVGTRSCSSLLLRLLRLRAGAPGGSVRDVPGCKESPRQSSGL